MIVEDTVTFINSLKSKFQSSPAITPPPAGLYHYVRENKQEKSRVHLRIDPDGSGLLLVNANRVMHLNPTAALMAYLHLEAIPREKAVLKIVDTYHVAAAQAASDYERIAAQVSELVRPDGACPICELELETTAPFSARPSAPYRMDLAITYRCNNDCAHCYNDRPRDFREAGTEDWKRIIDKVWEAGIPHVVFTGGEPTLRNDLPELVAYAGQKGMVTGLNTNGRRLMKSGYLEQLVQNGLDHVQITLESHDPAIHDEMVRCHGAWKQTVAGLRNALETPLYVMTNTTMLEANTPSLEKTLSFLSELGVPTIGLNALIYSGRGKTVGTGLQEQALPPLLEAARRITDAHDQRLIWYTPTQYCKFDPLQLELGVKGCTAALYNMCVEPDGAVLPCQSYYQPLGNLLKDPWKRIWNHELAVHLRERKYIPEKCHGCSLLQECGGGCPLLLEA